MKLLLSSYSLEPFPLEETFLLAKEIGADGVELVLMPSVFKLGLENAMKLSQKYGVPIVNIHQPPWGILFTGKMGISRLVKRARKVGAENVVVHLATTRRGFKSPFFNWVKNLEKESGINIAFENAAPRILERWPVYAGHPEKLEKFARARGISLTFDAAKAALAGIDPYQFFQKNHAAVKVVHVHGFDDGGGFHNGFAGGGFDWSGFTSFVRKFDYAGTVTLEIFPLHQLFYFSLPPRERLEFAKEIIKENFQVLKRA